MKSLSDLLKVHREIDDMFFDHQHSLLHFEFAAALSRLERYESALFRHMQDEEELLLPLYDKRCPVTRAGATKIFLDDHDKMRRFVHLFKEGTTKLVGEQRPESDLIVLLDREAFYKRLCSHHDKRESEILYPALDEFTSAVEKRELLSRVICEFDAARSSAAS